MQRKSTNLNKAQGTVEYLVIIAIVVVLSLVVVGIISTQTSSATGVTKSTEKISNLTSSISIAESIETVGGKYYVKLSNNVGEQIKITNVAVDNNSVTSTASLPALASQGFLIDSNIPCTSGTKQTKTVIVTYTSASGISKTFTKSISFDCANATIADTTVNGTTPTVCTENWSCTTYAPSTCPISQQQTRTCTDLENCGTTTNKPAETQSCTYVPPWWDASYAYRMKLSTTTQSLLPSDYTITLSVNTASLISGGKLRSDANDLRIVYYGGSTFTDLNRVFVSALNSTDTNISFNLVDAIQASSLDTNYWIYYGNNSPGAPNDNNDGVYLFFDNFEKSASLDTNKWGKWTSGSSDVYVQSVSGNNVLRLYTDGSNRAHAATINQFLPPIEVLFDWQYPHAWDMLQVATRSDGTGVLGAPTGGLRNGAEFYYYDGWASNTMGQYALNINNPNPTNVTTLAYTTAGNFISLNTWHAVKIADTDTNMVVHIDGAMVLTEPLTTTFATNKVSFCAREFNYARYFDNIRIKRYVANLPIITKGSEETQ